jgi:hypothetical protein
MMVTVSWYNDERTIMMYVFAGKWTWQEFYVAYDETIDNMDSVDHKVDFIMDMLKSEHIPFGALSQIKRAADRNHPNMGLAVYVGMNPLLQSIGNVFLKVYPKSAEKYPFDFATSIEEAQSKIAERRSQKL